MVTPEMYHAEINHRILDGCFLGLRERNTKQHETKSLTKISTKNALEYLASGTNLLWIASEMLEILTKIFTKIFKRIYNL